MKTITLDYDLYTKELAEAREEGKKSGIYCAVEYIKSADTYYLSKEKYFAQCKWLDEAIQERIGKDE